MRIKDVIQLYDFYRPLCVEAFGGSPFRCQYSGYVVDGKLIDYNDNIICNDISMFDDYHVFDIAIDHRGLRLQLRRDN